MPAGPRAAMASLHFAEPQDGALAALSDRERDEALQFCARSGLALFVPRDLAPQRLAVDAAKNLERLHLLHETYGRVTAALQGIDFIALKGITQCEFFGIDPTQRAQYDIDL